jgi:hypothetical protein
MLPVDVIQIHDLKWMCVILLILQARLQSSAHASEIGQEMSESGPERTCSASQAIIEMAVKTGLSLLFALLRQSWQHNTSPGIITSVVIFFADTLAFQFFSFNFCLWTSLNSGVLTGHRSPPSSAEVMNE